MLAKTLLIYPKFPNNWADIKDFYLEAFEDVPLDLVEKALKYVRLTCTFFPTPAEMRKAIEDDLGERHQLTYAEQKAIIEGGTNG